MTRGDDSEAAFTTVLARRRERFDRALAQRDAATTPEELQRAHDAIGACMLEFVDDWHVAVPDPKNYPTEDGAKGKAQ